jgi:hypothetical protein
MSSHHAVAVLSDIHGVAPALDAVLAELVTLARGGTTTIPDPIGRWAAQRRLSDHHVARLAGLPHPVTLDVDGFAR